MIVTKETRQTAIVNHTAQFDVDSDYWQSLIDQGMSNEEALEEAQSNGRAESVAFTTELSESVMVHETGVECTD